jgi:predicted PurR-regulated permease PerM
MFPRNLLEKSILVLLFLVLFFGGLYLAAPFLKPLSVAILLSLIFLPLARWLEKKGISRLFSTALCTLLFILFLVGIAGLVTYQGQRFGEDYTMLKQKAGTAFDESTGELADRLGLSQDELINRIRKNTKAGLKSIADETISGITGSVTDILLIIVYLFAFMYYRGHFKKFILKVFRNKPAEEVTRIMEESLEAAIMYLRGKFLLIGMLAVVYSLGLWAIGVKFSVFFGVLAALLTLIPFIGNIIGGSLPAITALLYGDITSAYLVIALFVIVQVIESYVLTPLVVGKEVDLHPIMSIVIVVLFSLLWGVVGMLVAIPYLGIVRFLLGNIENTKPYAFLLEDESNDPEEG